MLNVELTQLQSMFKLDDDGIARDGISVDELNDDELIKKATKADDDQEEEDTSEDSSTKKKTEDEEEEKEKSSEDDDSEEDDSEDDDNDDDKNKKVPFHKHPRFKEITRSNKELKETVEKANKTIAEMKSSMDKSKEGEDEPVAQWFKDLYGEETEQAWKIYNQQSKKDRNDLKKEIIEEMKEEAKAPAKQEEKMNEWVKEEVERLEEDNEFDKNKLLKVMVDYKPTNDDGNLDFDKGLKLYNKLYPEKTKDKTKTKIKKSIADSTTSDKKTTKSKPKYMTSEMLRNRSMSSLAESDE